jgi:hypothetical protein
MARHASLDALSLRKQLLVARCEIQRLTLALEVVRVQTATAWVPKVGTWVGNAAPWLLLGAPLTGFLAGRKPRALRSFAAGLFWGWRVWRRTRQMFHE